MASERASDEERARVGREHGEEHSHDRPEPELRDVANQQEAPDPGPDPGDAEQRDPEGGRCGLPDTAEPVDDECEDEGREQTAEHPLEPAQLQSQQRQREPEVAAEDERPEVANHGVQLVQREQPSDQREAEEPPPAQVDEADDQREQDRRDEDAREQRAHLAPNLRARLAYSSSADRSRSSPKSGHSVSSKTSSAYADCQSRKFEIRCSPDVRITRSGSGSSGA